MSDYFQGLDSDQKSRANQILIELAKVGITNKNLIAGILAVISKESNFSHLKENSYAFTSNTRIKEIFGSRVASLSEIQLSVLKSDYNDFFNLVYGGEFGKKNLGNTLPGDGSKYVGRGYNQITGKSNYKTVSDLIKMDLVSSPEKLETPTVAAKAIAAFYAQRLTKASDSGVLPFRYGINSQSDIKDAQTGLNLAFDLNSGDPAKRLNDSTGGYNTAKSRVESFISNISDFAVKNKGKIGLTSIAFIAATLFF